METWKVNAVQGRHKTRRKKVLSPWCDTQDASRPVTQEGEVADCLQEYTARKGRRIEVWRRTAQDEVQLPKAAPSEHPAPLHSQLSTQGCYETLQGRQEFIVRRGKRMETWRKRPQEEGTQPETPPSSHPAPLDLQLPSAESRVRAQTAAKEQEESALPVAVKELQAVIQQLRKHFGVEPPPQGLGSASPLEELCSGTRALKELLPLAAKRELAVEALAKRVSCPLSLEQFRKPMLAPDGQTYERSVIIKWLKLNPISPTTREPIRQEQLIRNRPVESAIHVLSLLKPGHTDQFVDESSEEENEEESSEALGQPEEAPLQRPVGIELVDAIENQQADWALELLQRPLDEAVLNSLYGEHQMTLLQMALLKRLPMVALALVSTASFVAADPEMGAPRPSVTAMHIAAALGDTAVCQALHLRFGNSQLGSLVQHDFSIASCGEELRFERHMDSLDIAELHQQRETVTFLRRSVDAWLAAHDL